MYRNSGVPDFGCTGYALRIDAYFAVTVLFLIKNISRSRSSLIRFFITFLKPFFTMADRHQTGNLPGLSMKADSFSDVLADDRIIIFFFVFR